METLVTLTDKEVEDAITMWLVASKNLTPSGSFSFKTHEGYCYSKMTISLKVTPCEPDKNSEYDF